ncbi:cytochrome P450 4V2-like [Culex pipiens pallens]|uniref:cytochrome P450 4V2-like n=1 Tax=Culex pipiens pallens TaxID=42434 RepID=UPI001953AB0F|nr:cytochrome P450 4V2-like [Culex pipiens pallens]
MVFIVLLSIVGALLVLQYLLLFYAARYSASIPTIQPSYPIVGNIPSFWGKSSKQALWAVVKSFQRVDRMGKLMIGPKPILLVNHPDLLQQILMRGDLHDKPFFYDFMGLGGGLITERDGKRWLMERKVLNPTFNTRMLTSFLPIMDARARKMVANLGPMADGRTVVDLLKYVGECTLEIVFNTTMGRNANELPGQREYVKHLDIIMTRLGERMMNVNQFLDIFYRMTSAYKSEHASRIFCNDFTDKIIRERRTELHEEQKMPQETDEFERKSLNFLDQILTIVREDGTSFTDQEISDNLYTMMSAAHETSALTVSYTCLLLAMHPKIQAKVIAEMNEVFYDSSVEITLDTLKQLEYTERVIKEVLRLLPAVPIGARQTNSELLLDGVQIPKNQILAFNCYNLHRRTDFWGPDPERFDPDRFLPEASQGRHPYAYIPFSAGLRNCIGMRYAMNSMRIMLLRILQEFEIGTDLKQTDLRFKFEITLKLVGPHSVWLKRRDKI